jgi:hypothetical protein
LFLELSKKRKEFEEWFEKTKLGQALMETFEIHEIHDLPALVVAYQNNTADIEAVYQTLKPIPLRKVKQCIQELENYLMAKKELPSAPANTAETDYSPPKTNFVKLPLRDSSVNTTISLSVYDKSFEGTFLWFLVFVFRL